MNTKSSITPAPGIILIEPLEHQEQSLTLGENRSYINKGKIIAVGAPLPTLMNTTIPSPVKEGQICWFYGHDVDGPYDNFTEDGKKYYCVKFDDVRATLG